MIFTKESFIRASPERVFAFHELPDALDRLTPPGFGFRTIEQPPNLHAGARAIVRARVMPGIWLTCVSLHTAYDPPRFFEDTMIEGPFRSWRHRHLIRAAEGGAMLRDEIEYELPWWILDLFVAPRMRRLFDYRHEVTKRWCEGS